MSRIYLTETETQNHWINYTAQWNYCVEFANICIGIGTTCFHELRAQFNSLRKSQFTCSRLTMNHSSVGLWWCDGSIVVVILKSSSMDMVGTSQQQYWTDNWAKQMENIFIWHTIFYGVSTYKWLIKCIITCAHCIRLNQKARMTH